MEPDTRLADYLDGRLDAEECARVETELAGDADLRVRLEAMRRADTALASASPPEPSEGFRARLTERIAPAVSARIARDASPSWHAGSIRHRRRAVPALAAAAGLVGIVAVVAIGVSVRDVPGEPADDMRTADDAPVAESFLAEAAPGLDGPVVVDGDRVLDDASASLLELDPMVATAEARLAGPAAEAIAHDWRDRLIGAPAQPDEERVVDERVRRCLVEVLDTDPIPIPVYIETARDADGAVVLAFGLVSLDPATSVYTRREAWIVYAADCHLVAFAQR